MYITKRITEALSVMHIVLTHAHIDGVANIYTEDNNPPVKSQLSCLCCRDFEML